MEALWHWANLMIGVGILSASIVAMTLPIWWSMRRLLSGRRRPTPTMLGSLPVRMDLRPWTLGDAYVSCVRSVPEEAGFPQMAWITYRRSMN